MWGCVLVLGCQKNTAAPALDAGPGVVEPTGAEDAGWTLTEAQLDAWLGWQKALLALPAPDKRDAGWTRDDVKRQARLEAQLRADAGLLGADVDRIEAVVAAVVTERNLAKLTGADALAQFKVALDELSVEQRAKAEQALADLKSRTAGSLAGVEAQFGAESVRVVLSREAEVTKTWDALLEKK